MNHKQSYSSHPERERFVIICKSQIEFCEGNQCAAAVLSFLEYRHNLKLDSDAYNKKSHDIAETHEDSRSLSENVYQYHSLLEISDGILNLYNTKSISKAIKFLESKSVVAMHRNPSPRHHYDKTKYFRFYPEIYNAWLKTRELNLRSLTGPITAHTPVLWPMSHRAVSVKYLTKLFALPD